MQKFFQFFVSFILFAFIISCVSIGYNEDPEKYRDEITELQLKIKKNPNDTKSIQDLGIINFKISDYKNAKLYLENANNKDDSDAQTILYLGLAYEFLLKPDEAIQIYKSYSNLPVLSPYRKKIEGRFHWLTRQKIQAQLRTLLLQETQLTEENIVPGKIAVFPFNLVSDNPEYSSLGRGLSEMIITDLSQVKEIELIERARINVLLEEIALGQTGVIEERTAPRFGKLLGAGKIVHGNFSITSKNYLKLDAAFWDILKQQFPKFTEMSDGLDNLFKLEKDIVFNIIDKMEIHLTEAEKRKIQTIPTKNMQAFMAYCKGLEAQDNGNFEAAFEQFNNAYKLDPNFSSANENSQKSASTNQATGSKEHFAGMSETGKTIIIETDRLIADRLRNLNTSIGSSFNPGDDNRKATEEAANAGAAILDLPDPPNPPPVN